MIRASILLYSSAGIIALAGCSQSTYPDSGHAISQKSETKIKSDEEGTTTVKKTSTSDVAPDGTKTETKVEEETKVETK